MPYRSAFDANHIRADDEAGRLTDDNHKHVNTVLSVFGPVSHLNLR